MIFLRTGERGFDEKHVFGREFRKMKKKLNDPMIFKCGHLGDFWTFCKNKQKKPIIKCVTQAPTPLLILYVISLQLRSSL